MDYLITSSPLYDDRNEVIPDNGFLDILHGLLPPSARALYVCSTPGDHALTMGYGDRLKDSFLAAGVPVASWEVLDRETDMRAADLIAASDWIILAGGHVPTQNAYFREIGLREKLAGFGGLVMGISAGSMNMADTVYAQPEYEPELADPDYRRWIPGLGLTDCNILPHYNLNAHDCLLGRRIYEDIACGDSLDVPEGLRSSFSGFFVLPDGSFILGRSERTGNGGIRREETLCGEAYRVLDGRMEQICQSGQRLRMPFCGQRR